MDAYRRSESRTSSEPSRLTGDESAEFAHQDMQTESMSTEWTDEKHSLYLNSMEASFVNQLYNSMELLGSRSQKEILHPKFSGQFKVLRRGCWQKINFQRPESEMSMTNESHEFLKSPWIQHFRYVRKPQVVASLQETTASKRQAINLNGKKTMFFGSESGSRHSYLCDPHSSHCVLVDSNTEMSDQNFVDEDIEGEKTGGMCSSKRMKTLTISAANNDQVVPIGKVPVTEDVTEKCTSTDI